MPSDCIQADGTEGTASFINNYNYSVDLVDSIFDYLVLEPINLTNQSDALLSFDLAYTYYQDGALHDGLFIELSTDCGASYSEIIYEKYGDDLITIPGLGSSFVPTSADQWRNESIDLTPYIGDYVFIRFVNHSGFGNGLYVDNINISTTTLTAQFEASSDNVCLGDTVTFTSTSTGGVTSLEWTFDNATVLSDPNDTIQTVVFNTSGTQNINLNVSDGTNTSSTMSSIMVNPLAEANFSYTTMNNTVDFGNSSNNADNYFWFFGDGGTSIDNNPTHIYETVGDFNAYMVATNDCGTDTSFQVVQISTLISTIDINNLTQLSIRPNPSDGVFNLVIHSPASKAFEWSISTMDGKSRLQGVLNIHEGDNHAIIGDKNLFPGIYLLKWKDNTQVKLNKLLVIE